ncbi:MAG: DUF4080 domain-containing protein [Oscillospiraceae bacterium]
MNAVICSLNSKYIHSSLAPWCLFAGVKEYCESDINASVIEGTINEPINNIIDRIIKLNPDVVGFCTYIWNVSKVYEIVKSIKKSLPKAVIILGGPEVSYNAEEVLFNNKLIDFVLSGEGEKSFPELLTSINTNSDYKKIEGICYRDEKNIVVNPPCILSSDPVSPYTKEFFDSLNGRISYLETSRGCPYSCAFCLSGRCGNARFFDIERAKNDIILLANSGTKTIKLVDRTFNANKKRAKELFQFIIDNYGVKIPSNVCIHFEIAGDILDDETIEILSKSPIGAIQMEIGLQSFNEKTLTYINRKTNIKRLKSNIEKLIKSHNIHIHIDLIAGLPFEDLESFKDSFNTAFLLYPNMLQLGFLKLLHGADMRENAEKYPCEFSKNPPYEVKSTPWMNENSLSIIHLLEDALDRIYNSGRFKRTINYLINEVKIAPFDLFFGISDYLKSVDTDKISLDKYTDYLFNYLTSLDNADKKIIRDLMVCDRLSTNPSGTLPKSLQIEDKNLKRYKTLLNIKVNPVHNIKRGIAILYSLDELVFVDYINKNPISGEFEINVVPLSELLEMTFKGL